METQSTEKPQMSEGPVKRFVTVNLARILAHLYCGVHWSWNVYYSGDDANNPTEIMAASGTGDSFQVEVYTYPSWLVRVKRQ